MTEDNRQHGIDFAKDWEFSSVLRDEITQFIDEHYVGEDEDREELTVHRLEAPALDFIMEDELHADYSAPVASAPTIDAGAPEGLRSWLDQLDAPFSTTLMELIDAKGLSDTDVYKRANMSRQLFSRIRSDADYRPAKKTVIALAIAMKLDLQETQDLLERAGFALSRSSKRDVIVEYFITKGKHDLFAINEALYEFDQPLI